MKKLAPRAKVSIEFVGRENGYSRLATSLLFLVPSAPQTVGAQLPARRPWTSHLKTGA